MAKVKYKISVVTVTYGNRWIFLNQVIQRVLSSALVDNVIVVDNASVYDLKSKIAELNDPRVTLIVHTGNLGSAAGYGSGINYAAQQTGSDFIWLLDDDNLPDENTPDLLVKNWDELNGNPKKTALYCLRADRQTHVNIARGENPYRYYLVPDNFLGFNLFRIFKNQLAKFNDKFKAGGSYLPHAKIPYVPYGGLMFHRSIIADIGLPNAAMFLYVDDSEYTYRITQNNGTIWLIPECRVIDLEQSQGISYRKKLFHAKLLDQWNFRTYYHVRNRVYFYSEVAIKNRLIFNINKALYLSYLQVVGLLSSKGKQYKQVVQAVNDGLTAKLGKATNDKFE